MLPCELPREVPREVPRNLPRNLPRKPEDRGTLGMEDPWKLRKFPYVAMKCGCETDRRGDVVSRHPVAPTRTQPWLAQRYMHCSQQVLTCSHNIHQLLWCDIQTLTLFLQHYEARITRAGKEGAAQATSTTTAPQPAACPHANLAARRREPTKTKTPAWTKRIVQAPVLKVSIDSH